MLAAQLQLHDAVPALRELEESEHVGGSGGDWQNERYRDGEINPFNRSQFSLRLRVHLALRLLGEKPRELPCNAFQCIRRGELAERVDLPSLAEAREERVGLVKRGMKPLEVLLAVGAPDYVLDPYWEYDIDAARPFTLRLRFKDGQVLDRIQRQRPARWQRKGSRWDDENK
jgi:hypothetical protein